MKPATQASGTRPVTGGGLVVAALRALGVRQVFGVPGGQTLAITDAILDCPEIRFVTARDERAAACMADAAGRLTGRLGVCLATTGPGATNLLTGIGGAYRDSSPVLALTCNNRLADLDRDDAQGADHVQIFRALTKWATLVTEPAAIPRALAEAALRATGGCPGPVLVDFARTALEAELNVELDDVALPQPSGVPHHRLAGDPDRLRTAARLLKSARQPVMWVGNGVQLSGAADDALALAEQLQAPVITTFNALGSLPSQHPLVFGPLSRMGTELSRRALAGADLVLAVGNSLNAISTGRWTLDLPEQIVQIDVDPDYLARNYPDRTLGLLGDARTILRQLSVEITSADGSDGSDGQSERIQRLERLQDAKRSWWASVAALEEGEPGKISPAALVRSVRSATPAETLLVVDAGNPGVWSHLWEVRAPGTYLKPVGYGNMGFAVPGAIAAKLVDPDRPVVALVGDGSLGMSLAELETAVREGVDPCIVVMNDAGYGNIRQEQLVHYGDRLIGVDFGDVDYAAIARACGLAAVRVDTTNDLETALEEFLALDSPSLIDARIDPEINAWTFELFRQYDLES